MKEWLITIQHLFQALEIVTAKILFYNFKMKKVFDLKYSHNSRDVSLENIIIPFLVIINIKFITLA